MDKKSIVVIARAKSKKDVKKLRAQIRSDMACSEVSPDFIMGPLHTDIDELPWSILMSYSENPIDVVLTKVAYYWAAHPNMCLDVSWEGGRKVISPDE